MKEQITEIATKIIGNFNIDKHNFSIVEHRNQLTLILENKEVIRELLKELKENIQTKFDMLTDITAIDWARKSKRFELVYFLYSSENKSRLRVKIPIEENNCTCLTIEKIYSSANWYEREVWDMYGIKFDEHSDLRRFYMPEDFQNFQTGEHYHPLRKDFPLMGIPDSLPLPPFPERTGKEIEW
jgi:NADH-quinone oxidoreductase subunit C